MEKNIGFKIFRIKTEQFAIIEENFVENSNASIITDLEFKANKVNHIIGVYTTFTYKCEEKAFLKLEISCHFVIAPDSWEKLHDNNIISFPKDFMTHLAMMTIGTARGVLHSKTEETKFNQFLLPTINVQELVKDNVTFTFED